MSKTSSRGMMRRLAIALLVAVSGLLAPSAALAGTQPLQVYENPAVEDWQYEQEGDCLYAAAAAWESFELGVKPTVGQVFEAWWNGGQQDTVQAFNRVWGTDGIDGVRARVTPVGQPPMSKEGYIVGLNLSGLPAGSQWRSYYQLPTESADLHAVFMVRRGKAGVWAITWGLEWHLTYSEWNSMQPAYYAVQLVTPHKPHRHKEKKAARQAFSYSTR